MNRRTQSLLVVRVLVAVTVLAGCSEPATSADPDTSDSAASQAREAQAALDKVNEQLEGLDPAARREKLIELGQAEGGEVTFYTSQSIDDISPIIEAFEDQSDIDVNLYRAGGDTVINRIQQEVEAGHDGADTTLMDGSFLLPLDRDGRLLKFDTPLREEIQESGRFDKWLAGNYNAYIAMWNTDAISPAEAPKSWEDVLSKYQGRLGVDPSDFDWFMSLVTDYFMAEKGMTEEEAIQVFRDGLEEVRAIRGHSVGVELLSAGEFDVHASQNWSRIADIGDAPLGWSPPVQPIVVRMSGVGMVSTTQRPASALLLAEFLLSDAQSIFVEQGLLPANISTEGGDALNEYDTVVLDVAKLRDEQDKWSTLFDEITGAIG